MAVETSWEPYSVVTNTLNQSNSFRRSECWPRTRAYRYFKTALTNSPFQWQALRKDLRVLTWVTIIRICCECSMRALKQLPVYRYVRLFICQSITALLRFSKPFAICPSTRSFIHLSIFPSDHLQRARPPVRPSTNLRVFARPSHLIIPSSHPHLPHHHWSPEWWSEQRSASRVMTQCVCVQDNYKLQVDRMSGSITVSRPVFGSNHVFIFSALARHLCARFVVMATTPKKPSLPK